MLEGNINVLPTVVKDPDAERWKVVFSHTLRNRVRKVYLRTKKGNRV